MCYRHEELSSNPSALGTGGGQDHQDSPVTISPKPRRDPVPKGQVKLGLFSGTKEPACVPLSVRQAEGFHGVSLHSETLFQKQTQRGPLKGTDTAGLTYKHEHTGTVGLTYKYCGFILTVSMLSPD